MDTPQQSFPIGRARCGNCGCEIPPEGRPRTYCSETCRKNASHLRRYWRNKNEASPRYFEGQDRRQKCAAAWREKARAEKRCVRCGRDNDRKDEGKAVCTNCVVDIKGGPT